MINLAVVFGSRTVEHDVSVVTGLQLLEAADREKYAPYPVYISREGEWFIGEPLRDMKFIRNFRPDAKGITKVCLMPTPKSGGLYSLGSKGLLKKAGEKIAVMDCAILALHGMHGEDGTIQGLFELADIPYSSVGVTGSGVGMDKIVMKAVFKSMGLPVLRAEYFYRSEFLKDPESVLDRMEVLGYPLIVKPANLGSSIGIGVAKDRESLREKIVTASYYDRRILVEKCLEKPQEINCAALGYGADCIASLCEQPVSREELLTFGDKYLNIGAKTGMASLSRIIPAPIEDELTKAIQSMTLDVFKMLECKGVVRIDYMIDRENNKIYINEINTIPGSFAYYLFEPLGITYSQIIDRIVECAFLAYGEKQQSVFSFDSALLSSIILGGRKGKLGGRK